MICRVSSGDFEGFGIFAIGCADLVATLALPDVSDVAGAFARADFVVTFADFAATFGVAVRAGAFAGRGIANELTAARRRTQAARADSVMSRRRAFQPAQRA